MSRRQRALAPTGGPGRTPSRNSPKWPGDRRTNFMVEPLRFEGFPGRYWHRLEDGRVQCDVCPRYCRLNEGQRGLCFVRGRQDNT
jgi:hypothetical protein